LPLDLKKKKVKVAFPGQVRPSAISCLEFYEKTAFCFINNLEFSSLALYQEVCACCKKKFLEGKISDRAKWLGIKWRNFISKGYVEDVSIRWISDSVGFGLFTEKPLEAQAFVGEYMGVLRKCPLFFANVNPYCFRYPLYRIGPFFYVIDAEKAGNEMSFINHSSNPNLEAVASLNDSIYHISFRAIRPIGAQEELTYDYGMTVSF